ncbi:MAG: RtcB family protein [Candidatus Kapabacteria bacterium]|nr:RtcB family protein [Candidatus Kapabacteria bacterium]MCS7169418.1 RtcB family protein [Candidatus Kapabacteria bacterium]
MRVPARVYASEELLEQILCDRSLEQLINVTTLPGIQEAALVMPDAHEGYGFPIGGIAAMDVQEGVISPGGIGYDINCGVRLLVSELTYPEVEPRLELLARAISKAVPSGVGRGGRLKLSFRELESVLNRGAQWAMAEGYAEERDLDFIESHGSLQDADAEAVSKEAKERGRDQLGTMGAGNHFVEVDFVEKIYDKPVAQVLGLRLQQVVVLIHTGSRGLGHQVATDYIRMMLSALSRYNIHLPDRELACAPFHSPEGMQYFRAMCAAANFAWANRQLITWEVRQTWRDIFGEAGGRLRVLYDVAHNIAKVEQHLISGQPKRVLVHRKGATRAFPPEHPETPEVYRRVGQPVLIPGSMGTSSYVLVGALGSMEQTFGSTCHGAGRQMSRHAAKRQVDAEKLRHELRQRGIIVQAGSVRGLVEEAPIAYKDVDAVVRVVDTAGIARMVARLRPMAVVKG